MKKNILGIKGFAMSELLAASIVILLLFSILFANYLPLVSEFENRILYTDVTANYGAFYVRKIYKSALEDDTVKRTLDQALTTNSYYTIYKSSNRDHIELLSGKLESQLRDIIDEYDIEEIIITNYTLDNLKGKHQNGNSKRPYEKSSGALYSYIKYLPFYTLSKYEGKVSEPYRILLKTKYGYATTQIIPDLSTPINCFDFDKNSLNTGKFKITNYHQDCGKNVDITPYEISVDVGNGVKKGIITAIADDAKTGKGAFEGKGIVSVNLSKNVTSIGKNAFKNNSITMFNFKFNAPGVKSVGDYAFSGNKLEKIVIPNTLNGTNIGEGVFANNYSLKTIVFDYDNNTPRTNITKNMFGLEYNAEKMKNNLIDLVIPTNITSIEENAFKNLQFSSIEFEDNSSPSSSNSSKLETIGVSAFEIDENLFDNSNTDNYISIKIPHTVQTIYSSAFKNVKIEKLEFNTNNASGGNEDSNLITIGDSAFKVKATDETKIDMETRSVKIPVSVRTIGNYAFENQALSEITFDGIAEDSELNKIGDYAFSGNKIKKFKIPQKLITPGTSIGKKIFGDNYTLGNNIGDIYIDRDLSTDQNWHNTWCVAFYGDSGCTTAVTTNDNTSIYINGSNTKYITYVNN